MLYIVPTVAKSEIEKCPAHPSKRGLLCLWRTGVCAATPNVRDRELSLWIFYRFKTTKEKAGPGPGCSDKPGLFVRVQVYRFRRLHSKPCLWTRSCPARYCSASGDLLLHLSGTVICYRRISGRNPCQPRFSEACLVHLLFSAADRGANREVSRCQPSDRQRETYPALTAAGLRRFILGLSKKLLLSNTVGQMADLVFTVGSDQLDVRTAWLGAVCYCLQIYFDFSGYSDMAIGLGHMFGFHFLENFDHPYVSASIQEFWRRWHISLSSWFRDYLYIPLGGNRKGKLRTELNKCIVFFCTGLWHGASWNFVLWGLWHGLFMILEGFLPKGGKLRRILGHASTLLIVLLGFVLFRADTLSDAGLVFAKMFAGTEITLQSTALLRSMLTPYNLFILSLSVVFSLPLLPRVKRFAGGSGMAPALLRIGSYGVSAALFALCIMNLAGSQFNPFIYFRF